MDRNNEFGLDWWTNSEHGGGFTRWGAVSGLDLGVAVEWNKVTGLTLQGSPHPENSANMWRWQSLSDWSFRDVMLARRVFPNKMVLQGFEWNAPGHEHVDVCIINNQFDAENPNCLPVAEFEYKFDNGDADTSNPNGWVKSALSGKDKTLEAVAWMQENYPSTSWIIPTHPERANRFKIEDFRNMNNAGPDVCFGFDSQPGHQKAARRGGYRPTSYGVVDNAATWGGTGAFAAHIGGVWDALLSEGRKWWLFANSDFHATDDDFFPGEYQKTYIYAETDNAQGIVDGLRSGNSFIVMGDLIDMLNFNIGAATMGQTLETENDEVTVTIVVRDPQGENFNTYSNFNNPELDHIDIIAGVVTEKIAPDSPDYTLGEVTTTKVIARFGKTPHTDADGIVTQVWNDLGNGVKEITYTMPVTSDMYVRLRGTHHAFGAPNSEIDDKGNPLPDPFGENNAIKAFEDLWFYSNPIFIEKKNPASVTEQTNAKMTIHPNPASNELLISGLNNISKVELSDLNGRSVFVSEVSNTNKVNLSNMDNGVYVIHVQADGKSYQEKVIVKK